MNARMKELAVERLRRAKLEALGPLLEEDIVVADMVAANAEWSAALPYQAGDVVRLAASPDVESIFRLAMRAIFDVPRSARRAEAPMTLVSATALSELNL